MSYIGHWIEIQCFKHDGHLHREWDRGLVLEDNEDYVVIASKRAKVLEANGRKWFTKEPAVTIFAKKQWFNVIAMLKSKGIVYYCNIASPALIDQNKIKYIDYDLDVKLFDNDDIRLLDEKEYKSHRKKYGYSDDLDKVLHLTTDLVVEKMKRREFPFDDQAITDYYDDYTSFLKS